MRGKEVNGSRRGKRPQEFYAVKVAHDGKVLWRGMTLVHIKDLNEDQKSVVNEEVGRLREQGFGRDRIQKRIAEEHGVYVPETVLRKLVSCNGEIDWSRSRIRGPYRDHRKRNAMYQRVLELRDRGWGYNHIIKEIEKEFGERLSRATVVDWCNGIHSPNGAIKKIEETSDVFWLTGFIMADGSIRQSFRRNHKIRTIRVYTTDEEIVEKIKSMNLGYINIYFNSREVMITLSGTVLADLVEEVKGLIGQARYDEFISKIGDEGTRMFIRGFFDGDGSGLFVSFANSDLRLLEFIRYALGRFGIETSRPVLMSRRGASAYHGPKGERITKRRDVYIVFVYPDHYDRFFELIGSTMERKLYHMRLSMRILQRHSRRYGRSYLEEIKRRYASGEGWADVILPLVKGIGARMRRTTEKITSPHPPKLTR